jgi:hypothetical protein
MRREKRCGSEERKERKERKERENVRNTSALGVANPSATRELS